MNELAVLPEIESVTDGARAAVLVQHPVRRRILALARTPMSATEIAGRLGMPRQRINYHVRQLERARFLSRAARRMRRNMVEQQYVATARSYVITPEVLGPLAAHEGAARDAMSAAALFAIASQAQSDLSRVVAQASAEGKRVATLSLTADIRFESAEQREAFTVALEQAIVELTARSTSPFTAADGSPGSGRPFRLFVGCHPIPREDATSGEEPSEQGDSPAAG